jgi:galactokinase
VETLADVTVEQYDQLKVHLPDSICTMVEHIVRENGRALDAAEALRAGDMEAFGQLLDDSYTSSRQLVNSGPALDPLWEAAQGHPGRIGGRLVGHGGAGSMLFLVDSDATDEFAGYLSQRYSERAGGTPSITVLHTANGAEVIATPG